MDSLMGVTKQVLNKMEMAHKKNINSDLIHDNMSKGSAISESTIPNRPELYEGEFTLRKMDKVIK